MRPVLGVRSLVVCLFLVSAKNGFWVSGQGITFGAPADGGKTSDDEEKKNETPPAVNTRASGGGGGGLVASLLGVDPLGEGRNPNGRIPFNNNNNNGGGRPPFIQNGNNNGGGRPPFNQNGNNNAAGNFQNQGEFCCCSSSSVCPGGNSGGSGSSFGGFIKPRTKTEELDEALKKPATDVRQADIFSKIVNNDDSAKKLPDIGVRIVNNPLHDGGGNNNGNGGNLNTCPRNTRRCCYNSRQLAQSFGRSCTPIDEFGGRNVFWQQGCSENIQSSSGSKQCGTRNFKPLFNLKKGEASPEEFPWTCLMLSDKNRFIGPCAIVPETSRNDIRGGTGRVITAAHKLNSLKANEGLKVRIIEYDASDFTDAEKTRHEEYTVVRFVKHPQFESQRLKNDIAVLILDRKIDLTSKNGVNAACFPSCRNMFDYKFDNGTGVRCWVAGWGKDAEDGNFQFIQHKVDVPLYDQDRCERRLKQELGRQDSRSGRDFFLTPGELCAGGEQGKDACDGDGGAPLVCKSNSGHWHVVGLVAWGVGCANPDVPGVYVNVAHYLDFITANHRRG